MNARAWPDIEKFARPVLRGRLSDDRSWLLDSHVHIRPKIVQKLAEKKFSFQRFDLSPFVQRLILLDFFKQEKPFNCCENYPLKNSKQNFK
jgi:hypothetical protein